MKINEPILIEINKWKIISIKTKNIKNTFINCQLIILLIITLPSYCQLPNWEWATRAGGIYTDAGNSICTDLNGNVYVAGSFIETATFGTFTVSTSGGQFNNDVFIAKYNSSGTCLWVNKAGGINPDVGTSVCTNSFGDVYISGYFNNIISFGAFTLTSNGAEDIFIAKYNSSGVFQWAQKAGGVGYDESYGIVCDNLGFIYITGKFSNTATFNTINVTSQGYADIFIAKYSSSGQVEWVKQAGGITSDVGGQGNGIKLDNSGNIYITGVLRGPINFDSQISGSIGSDDIFVAKYNTNAVCEWVKIAGAPNGTGDQGLCISVDLAGNSYISGYFNQTATFGGITNVTASGTSGLAEFFIAKYNTNGDFKWVRKGGGIYHDRGYGITVDLNSNCYVTGYFSFVSKFDSITVPSLGGEDAFVAKYDSNGYIKWVRQAGGPQGSSMSNSICIDNFSNLYITGHFDTTAFFGTIAITAPGPFSYNNNDIFIAKLNAFDNVEEIENQVSLKIYPNPTNSKTTIVYPQLIGEGELQVYNMFGELVYEEKLIIASTQKVINIESFKSGIYKVIVREKGMIKRQESLIKN